MAGTLQVSEHGASARDFGGAIGRSRYPSPNPGCGVEDSDHASIADRCVRIPDRMMARRPAIVNRSVPTPTGIRNRDQWCDSSFKPTSDSCAEGIAAKVQLIEGARVGLAPMTQQTPGIPRTPERRVPVAR